jgi:hypothetical protein
MGTTLPYTIKCPMCEYADTWTVITSPGPTAGMVPLAQRRAFVDELVTEHPNHPKPKKWPDAVASHSR